MKHSTTPIPSPETGLERIRRWSARLGQVCLLLGLLLVGGHVGYWAFYNSLPAAAQVHAAAGWTVLAPPAAATRVVAAVVAGLPLVVVILMVLTLRRLLTLYAAGVIFEPHNVKLYTRLSRLILFSVPAKILGTAGLSVVLTYSNPAGQKALAISVGSNEIFTLLLGAGAAIISWVMGAAQALEEERRLTI